MGITHLTLNTICVWLPRGGPVTGETYCRSTKQVQNQFHNRTIIPVTKRNFGGPICHSATSTFDFLQHILLVSSNETRSRAITPLCNGEGNKTKPRSFSYNFPMLRWTHEPLYEPASMPICAGPCVFFDARPFFQEALLMKTTFDLSTSILGDGWVTSAKN